MKQHHLSHQNLRRIAPLVAALVLFAAPAMSDEAPSMFTSRETGPVPLSSFGGNVLNPYGTPPPTELTIWLRDMSKRALFGRLQLRHANIPFAVLTEPRLGTRFELRGVSVLGVSVNRGAPRNRPDIRVHLAVERFTVTATPRPGRVP
jgi:hypothetical protein